MRYLGKVALIACILLLLASCQSGKYLTKAEKALITGGSSDTPFSVLLTTGLQDSLFLRQVCSNISPDKDRQEIRLLIDRLKATLAVEQGVGIAAPQVGIARNIFLFVRIDKPDRPVEVAINPRIVEHPKERICFERDGCLSIPDRGGNSYRYPWVEVEYANENGELVRERLSGYSRGGDFTGIIFQHEYDHLQGILFIDKFCELVN